jgi:hypothetical protein
LKARGRTKIILQKVGEIQNLIGEARSLHFEDTNPKSFTEAQNKLQQAFDICLEIRNMYDPV